MCGLSGIFAYQDNAPSIQESELIAMRDSMIKRGPDGFGVWVSDDKRVGLAHRRLAILDLSARGTQPMISSCGRYQIVFNGEIYNYQELRKDLIKSGHKLKSNSDTEVILELFAKYGIKTFSFLRGMFAIAIWDIHANKLTLSRDPFGIKPLYIHDDGNTCRFASQVKSLLTSQKITKEISSAGLVGYAIWGHIPEPFTLYKNIVNLESGTCLTIDRQGNKEKTSFQNICSLIVNASIDSCNYLNLSDAVSDSVNHHLISDVPVGIFLSAGIDSSVILAKAAEQGRKLRAITLAFQEYSGSIQDEAKLAKQIASQYGFEHQTVIITEPDFEEYASSFYKDMDQPSSDGLNTWLISKIAHESGLKVALSGLGGDELFGGYPSFKQIPIINRVAKPFLIYPRMSRLARQMTAPLLERFTSVKYAGILESGGTPLGAYQLRRASLMPWQFEKIQTIDELLNKDFINQGLENLSQLQEIHEKELQQVLELRDPRLLVSFLEIKNYMQSRLLRDSDWASMSNSLEIRLPFVDTKLLTYIASSAKSGVHYTKSDLARTPKTQLPEAIIKRKKTGFTVPVQGWIMKSKFKNIDKSLFNWTKHSYRAYINSVL